MTLADMLYFLTEYGQSVRSRGFSDKGVAGLSLGDCYYHRDRG